MSLARQAFTGVLWTAVEHFGQQFVNFLVVIVLARLLTPEDFGLVAMLMVIFAVSSVLVNGGFTAALIREQELTEEDKSTAFWLNFAAAGVLYVVIWLAAPAVAAFFEQPELVGLTRFMALNLVFLAPTLVQQAVLTHQLSFKRLAQVGVGAAAIAGGIAVALAYTGAGVWALAAKYVLVSAATSVLFWIVNPWWPRHGVSRASFDKLFGFGSKLAASSLIDKVYQNIYKVVIGKFFAAATLGFYTQARTFQTTASTSLSGVLQKVTYPLLAKANDDVERLKRGYRKIIRVSSFVIFPCMVGLALTAEPLVLVLLGEKWRATIPFLQLLCASGALYHLHSINLNILKVVGRSDLFLKLEIIKKFNISLAIIIGLRFGIWGLLIGQVVSSYVALFINMYYTRRFIDYSMTEQIVDIVGVVLLSIPMAAAVLFTGFAVDLSSHLLELILLVSVGVVTYVGVSVAVADESLRTILDLLARMHPKMRSLAFLDRKG